MTCADDSTMAASEAADPPFKAVVSRNKSKRLKAMPGLNIPTDQTHSLTIRVYFLPPWANMKFNPIARMRTFLTELIKHDPSITVAALDKKSHLKMATDLLPANKTDF